jgi:hypothetical protein
VITTSSTDNLDRSIDLYKQSMSASTTILHITTNPNGPIIPELLVWRRPVSHFASFQT